ncbi:hypothetical protein NHJ13051_009005 [Beauveria bassiana]
MFLLWELCIAFPRSAESMQFCVRRDIQTLLLGGMIGRRRAPAVGAGKNVNAVNKVRVDIDRKGRGENRDGLDEQGDGKREVHLDGVVTRARPPAAIALRSRSTCDRSKHTLNKNLSWKRINSLEQGRPREATRREATRREATLRKATRRKATRRKATSCRLRFAVPPFSLAQLSYLTSISKACADDKKTGRKTYPAEFPARAILAQL